MWMSLLNHLLRMGMVQLYLADVRRAGRLAIDWPVYFFYDSQQRYLALDFKRGIVSHLLTTVSGKFNSAAILGAFFPAAIFVLLAGLLVTPRLPAGHALPQLLDSLDRESLLLAASAIAVLVAGLLYNLNIPLIKLYEGYPLEMINAGPKRRFQRQLTAAQARMRGVRSLARRRSKLIRERRLQETAGVGRKLNSAWNDYHKQAYANFPLNEETVLPTRLGNAIRKAEMYSWREYNMEAITLWPRLIAVLDEKYAMALANAQTSMNFMLNSSFLSATLAGLILVVGLFYPSPLASAALAVPWLLEIGFFAALAYICYSFAVGRAAAWGALIEGAFDLYRWKLAEQMGYKLTPRTRQEERDFWRQLSYQIRRGDNLLRGPRVNYK